MKKNCESCKHGNNDEAYQCDKCDEFFCMWEEHWQDRERREKIECIFSHVEHEDGMKKKRFFKCMKSIPDKYLDEFINTLEKLVSHKYNGHSPQTW